MRRFLVLVSITLVVTVMLLGCTTSVRKEATTKKVLADVWLGNKDLHVVVFHLAYRSAEESHDALGVHLTHQKNSYAQETHIIEKTAPGKLDWAQSANISIHKTGASPSIIFTKANGESVGYMVDLNR